MPRVRTYWGYSAGCAIVWAIVFLLQRVFGGRKNAQYTLYGFYGWCICWVSTTIARYVYPPPKRWLSNSSQE
jgi:hypothetical protein